MKRATRVELPKPDVTIFIADDLWGGDVRIYGSEIYAKAVFGERSLRLISSKKHLSYRFRRVVSSD